MLKINSGLKGLWETQSWGHFLKKNLKFTIDLKHRNDNGCQGDSLNLGLLLDLRIVHKLDHMV